MNNNYIMYFPANKEESFYKDYISFISEKEKIQNRNFDVSVLHHIVPRSFLPKEWRNEPQADIDNLVKLTPYEHLQAHELLYKAFPHTSMVNALWLMINDSSRHDLDISHISEEEYNRINKEASKAISNSLKDFYANNEEIHKRLSEQRTGKVFINNGEIERFVDPDIAAEEVNIGKWSYGMVKGRKKSDHMKEALKKASQGRYKGHKYIYNIEEPTICKRMKAEEAEKYVATGKWAYGRGEYNKVDNSKYMRTPEAIQKQKETKKTLIPINNGKQMKRVRPENLQEWLNKGWVEGVFVSEETREKIRKNNAEVPRVWSEESRKKVSDLRKSEKGYQYLYKDGIRKRVLPLEINKYLSEGWSFK